MSPHSVQESPLTYNEVLDGISQFLESAFHTILHLRRVYPPEVFRLHRLYQIPVYRSRHPGLNEYLDGVIKSIREELDACQIRRILFVVSSASTQKVLERYIFDVQYLLPHVRRADRDLAIKGNLTFKDMQLAFRAMILRLAVLDAGLEQLPDEDDITFAILLEVKPGVEENDTITRPGPGTTDPHRPDEGLWVPWQERFLNVSGDGDDKDPEQPVLSGRATGSQEAIGSSTRGRNMQGQADVLLPVRGFESGVVDVMLFVQDNVDAKAALCAQSAATLRRPEAEGTLAHTRQDAGVELGKRIKPRGSSDALIDVNVLSAVSRSLPQDLLRKNGRRTFLSPRPRPGSNAHDSADDSDPSLEAVAVQRGEKAGARTADQSEDDGSTPSSSSSATDISIESVEDFAGFGGAGTGQGGGGMSAVW